MISNIADHKPNVWIKLTKIIMFCFVSRIDGNFVIIIDSFDNISLDWFIDKNVVSQLDYKGLATPDVKIKDENAGKINTIVHFYENGTFKIFKNSD